jgi:steroid Delta-isomerase
VPTPDEIRAVVEEYVAASNRNDKAAVLELFAPDAVWHDPVGRPPHVGRDEIAAFFDQARTLADQIEMVPSGAPDHVIVCGNEAVLRFEVHATLGESTMVMDVIEVFEVDDDTRIASARAYWDMSRARARGE